MENCSKSNQIINIHFGQVDILINIAYYVKRDDAKVNENKHRPTKMKVADDRKKKINYLSY